ncbi:hypothetical protein HMPREF0578_1657 [Mobiluncus mulieris 28-1]|uniref:Uncharacterized protein n=1 Tax=Mobiluncus mulieris ATCC 35239 TaxID=871571 RepID=E0QMV5_9ACTO|nr:hypothetical protein HMPREF0577_1855 [Mobiluncus mulieris ATCC 35243]EEZ92368.1 hypothetical protein HMPREF0578_1657 [Mobiluncus mulieris 28-1]EFM47122.1 hypothetical protein HMPREF0580_0219 [Mobiluncus mulieris ATCC 35239]
MAPHESEPTRATEATRATRREENLKPKFVFHKMWKTTSV